MITTTAPMLGKRPFAVGIWRQYKDGQLVPRGGRGWRTVNGIFINFGEWRWHKDLQWGRCIWIGRKAKR